MCGILGYSGGSESAVRSAASQFSYRGPDAEGYFSDSMVSLGHKRLSIIDVDERSNQPFFSSDKTSAIVFNGEIYNYKELRDELVRDHAVEFRTESDTEVLLEGYRVWKEVLLPKLRGMFAFAIYDAAEGEIFLARDHAGIKPLYYANVSGRLYFGSEAKAVASLLREDGVPLDISHDAVGMYLVLGNIPSPMTLCTQIKKLPRGSWSRYTIESDTMHVAEWQPAVAPATTPEEMTQAIRASIIEHTVADVPVGVFFSGGIDSSVVALALKEAGINLTAFCVRVEGRDADEPYFREIALTLNVDAQVHTFGVKEFDGVFEHVLSKMDDPIADPSIFPTAFISQIAAKDVKVVLSGEGGDELFFGYQRALTLARLNARAEQFGVLEKLYAHTPSFRGKRALMAWLSHVLRRPVSYYLTQTALSLDSIPADVFKSVHAYLTHEDTQRLDRDWYLENMLMRKGDMATMYASIEGRVPLLGAQVWMNAPRFADENLRSGKDTLKDMLRTALPNNLIDRPKSGFGIPLTSLRSESNLLAGAIETARIELLKLFPEYRSFIAVSESNASVSYGLVALHRSIRNLGF